tara:strand:+ start:3666 stop:4076 length:411 start_codon:yes stop_codon:yes gene_type:complete
MSCNFNKVVLMGRLTRDPEMHSIPSGTNVTEIGLAINTTYHVGDEKRTETCFIDCNVFGRRAEVINDNFRTGRPILIEGRLIFNEWEKDDGTKGRKHRVRIESFEFLDAKDDEERQAAAQAHAEDVEEDYDSLIDA